jgi:hypothetical protein
MSIVLNDNLKIEAPKLIDARFGPHANLGAALAFITPALREMGLIFFVKDGSNLLEYWWPTTDLSDSGIALRSYQPLDADLTAIANIIDGGTGFLKKTAPNTWSLDTTVVTASTVAGGELEGYYPNPTLKNTSVINKVLSGFNTVGGGSIVDGDSILVAFGKVQNQLNALYGGMQFIDFWDASTNTPTIPAVALGNKGNYYIVQVAGSTNLGGITDWKVGDWAVSNGTIWSKIDNTDAVVSVNGETGIVTLTTSHIEEGSRLYYTDARVLSYGDTQWSRLGHTHTFASLTSKPTTISGYGITDAYIKSEIDNFFGGIVGISGYNKTNWDLAYGWGNHALAGYVKGTGVAQQVPYFNAVDTVTTSSRFIWNTSLNALIVNQGIAGTIGSTLSGAFDGGSLQVWNGHELAVMGSTVGNSGDIATMVMKSNKGNSTANGYIDIQGYYAGGTTNTPIIFQKLGGVIIIGNIAAGADATSLLQVNGPIRQTSVTSALLKASANGTLVAAEAGTDYLASFTETDPTVPAYAKTLSAFSVIKTSTDALYEPIFSKNTAFNKNFGSTSGTVAEGNDSRINNGQTAFGWGNHAGLYSLLGHTHTFSSLTSKPTTLVGYGITDAATSAQGTKADTAYSWGDHSLVGYFLASNFNSSFDTRLALKSTTDLAEGINLYYTQGRFDSAFALKSTTNLAEGTNLYYTAARFNTAFAAKSTSDLSEGTNLYYTDARVLSYGNTQWVQLDGAYSNPIWITDLAWSKLTGTPTSLLGYGILDAYTKGEVDTLLTGYLLIANFNSTFDARLALKTTSDLAEGSNLYFTTSRARSALSLSVSGSSGASNYNNTTGVLTIPNYTLAGLGGEASITAGTTGQYWRGDKTWQTLNSDATTEGSSNLYFTNTRAQNAITLTTNNNSGLATYSSGTLNIPNYTLAGLGGESAIAGGTTAQYWRGDKTWQTLNTDAVPEATAKYYTDARVLAYGNTQWARLDGSYTNPSWLVSLPWSKITNTPTTLGGYGITDAFTETEADARFVKKAGDIMTGTLLIAAPASIDSSLVPGEDILNLGTANASVINIGWSGATINIQGSVMWQDVDNLAVTDKLIRLNKGGATASGVSSGFEIEENAVITGWLATDSTRTGWDFKAPASQQLTLGLDLLTASRTIKVPNLTGTLLIDSGTYNDPAWLATLAWSKITGTPTTLSGYGITNAYTKTETDSLLSAYTPMTRQLTINGVTQDLLANRTWNVGTVTSVGLAVPTGFTSGAAVSSSGNLTLGFDVGYSLPTNVKQGQWDTAFNERNQWDGGATGLVAATGRASLGLGSMALENTGSYYTQTQINSFFSGGTAITGYDNSNWDTAYSWGNHAVAGYLTTSSAASTYVSLTGSYANPSWITSLAYSKITGVPAFLTSYTETDPFRVTSVAVSGTSTKTITLTRADSSTVSTTWTDIDTDTNTFASSLGFSGGTLTLTNNNASTVAVSLDGRYLQSYTETDTLASVTARGASTSTRTTFTNGVLSSTYGGAGSVSGILKANGSGVVSPVIASDITTLISGTYLPLSGGTLSGTLNGTTINASSYLMEY